MSTALLMGNDELKLGPHFYRTEAQSHLQPGAARLRRGFWHASVAIGEPCVLESQRHTQLASVWLAVMETMQSIARIGVPSN